MDEFVQLGWAKYLGNGLLDAVWHPKALGYAMFYKLAHLVGWDAASMLLIGRLQTALLACGTLALVYGCARAIGYDRLRSLAIVLVLLSFSNFIERIFQTIAEPLAVFFAAAALFVLLRTEESKPRTIILAGTLSGFSFLATQKAAYFNLSLGLALVIPAVLARQSLEGVKRGAWLVLGWMLPIIAYCFLFGGLNPLPVARNLFLGPMAIATTGADPYPGGLRNFVWQTLMRNSLLYVFCFAGMLLTLARFRTGDDRTRIALIFTLSITALVFSHNQPWPYVFIMALPFMALWAIVPIEALRGNPLHARLAVGALALAIMLSFTRNIDYLNHGNRAQLQLVARAEALLGPDQTYFDGVGMLPNRAEPSTLWLDRAFIQRTLQEGDRSEAYRIFTSRPPELILWSYRMKQIEPIVAPLIRDSYVPVSPNIRLAGRLLAGGRAVPFRVPVDGLYQLYGPDGRPSPGLLEIDGAIRLTPVLLERGSISVKSRDSTEDRFLLPEGDYKGKLKPGPDDETLFDKVYY